MKTFNIFIENIYPSFKTDEVLILSNVKKITEFYLSQSEIVENSCLKGYDFTTLCFDIVFCDDVKIKEINRDYRNKDKATDVISFAIFADSPPEERFILDEEINLGEIIVSLDRVKAQAKEHNVFFESELYFLIAHGILHCLGYDHNTENEFHFMMNAQEKAKAVINV